MWKKLLMFAITSGLAASAWKKLHARPREDRAGRPLSEREQIRDWENEGGSVAPAPERPRG